MTRPLPRPQKPIQLDVSLAIVNIVLLLIFFFLATGRLLNPVGPDLELSQTSELPLDQLPSPILVIAADGTWQLNGAELAPELLDIAMQDLPEPVVLHVLINRQAPANALVAVMNRPELSQTGIKLVTLHRRSGEARR